ncbi:hypothetical protein CBG25_03800 [Arsenophonus sp. ENCA]|uniref:CopG family transcriptional regulator n=1 Tax=Arsenophonus sp. ENCA TaxID=1987579 RepID=UPI000BCD721D|nr:CopG family transcriptional regulator [Arsenophonus sp. ENCA]PAV08506.1 hypothetical protein CBG25_03800 [Arsenophonus sp. ENCA]
MGLKKTSIKRNEITIDQAELLAKKLADRPYGQEKTDAFVRTTISLPKKLLLVIEDLALKNKRNGINPKNNSSIIRAALEEYLIKHK